MTTYDYDCPVCGGQMTLRANGRDGTRFFGCIYYPACTGTRDASGTTKDEGSDDRTLPSDRYRRNDALRWRDE